MDIGIRKHGTEDDPAKLLQDEDIIGIFGPGVHVEGKVKAGTGSLHLNASFKGTINSEGTVVIGAEGEVEADIQAKVVSITGRVKGSVHAAELLEIKQHGVVLGDVTTPVLVVDAGGFFEGQCHMPTPERHRENTPGTPTGTEMGCGTL